MRYIDEVLSYYVPYTLRAGGVDVFYMPNFVSNFQFRSREGAATTGKVQYYYGNLTGLERVHSPSCREPRWDYGNLTLYCNILFSLTNVRYTGRIRLISSEVNSARVQDKEFTVEGEVIDLEAVLEVTSSPYVKIPALRRLDITDDGRRVFRFIGIEEVPDETLQYHFEYKFAELFNDVFYNKFMPYFERAVSSARYPLE